ncbi:MAG: primosomal protein N', partial [Bacteroidales bacterium]|nr:primosomal protein N' [Bacteroidales bacterium]
MPIAFKGTFTYVISEADRYKAVPGMRVMVQFGQKKLYSGIIKETHQRAPEKFEAKEIISILDEYPLISDIQLMFWNWISGYYMCTLGEVMNAALPNGLKLASETVFSVDPNFKQPGLLNDQENLLLEFMEEDSSISLDEIRKGPLGDDGIHIVKKLVDKGAVIADQYLKKAYKPRKVSCISIAEEYKDEKALVALLESISKAPAQVKALEEYARLSQIYDDKLDPKEVEKQDLIRAGVAAHAITGLRKKGIFVAYEIIVSRIHHHSENETLMAPSPLCDFQEAAMLKTQKSFKKLPAVLLHGITSSGKTEIYIQLIQEQIDKGKQVLYLLPEIALTTQIIKRLKVVFGNKIGIYHSRYSDNERVEVYRNLSGMTENAPYSVILGVRSAVFLPFSKLGLIVVDEEHENTYKQYDPAPRYHARDAATILGLFTGAKILMGSATPSFESLHNTELGKYGLAEINERYGSVELPQIVIADITQARKRKQMKSHFTPELISALDETLKNGQQAILFQNRRGYSNYLQCEDCGFILKCKSCDVSLTYHKFSQEMVCHYCGYKL